MRKKKIILPLLGIILIVAGALFYMQFSYSYRNPYGSCIAGHVEELGGKDEDYREYCECFLNRTKELLSEKEYNEWVHLYMTDRDKAKEISLGKNELLNSQFGCFVQHAPLRMWAEGFIKVYTDVEKLPSDVARCIVEEFAKHIENEDTFVIFAQMKMQILEPRESFKKAEQEVKEYCIESLEGEE